MPPEPLPTLADVYRARARIQGIAARTPLVESPALSGLAGGAVRLKLETMQPVGAFKLRGAANRLGALSEAERRCGAVTVSTGNHGRAVAYAARRLGMRAVICLSELVPATKVEAIQALGAEVRIAGRDQDEATLEAERLAREEGLILVHPFDDPAVIAGQGTIGIELLEEMPDLDTAVIPLSGGGLLGGIALVLKAADPAIRVIGVSQELGPGMVESLKAGRPVAVEELPTLADSLGGGIGLDNRHTFRLARALLDQVVLVSEAEIAAGMRHLFRSERLVAEGGAAVGAAAILAGKLDLAGRRTAVVVSGRNVDMGRFGGIVGLPA